MHHPNNFCRTSITNKLSEYCAQIIKEDITAIILTRFVCEATPTMNEIDFPSRFDELVGSSSSSFQIVSEWNPCDLNDEEIKNHFDDLAGMANSDDNHNELSQVTIDVLYNFIANFSSLNDENRDLFAHCITELSKQAVETIVEQLPTQAKNAKKQIVYFLVEFVKVNEILAKEENAEAEKLSNQTGSKPAKGKAKKCDSNSYQWLNWRHCCLKYIFQALCTEPSHLWNMGVVQENFLRGMWLCCLTMLEDKPVGMSGIGVVDSTIRALCVAIITKSASLFDTSSGALSSLSNALLNAVIKSEHMANFVAEICNKGHLLCGELLKDISHMPLLSTSSGVKNIGTFIESLARVNPDLISQHLAILKGQIDSRAYQIRSSLVHAMGLLISYIHKVSQDLLGDKEKEPGNKLEGEDVEDEEVDITEEEEVDAETEIISQEKNIDKLCRVRDALLDLLTERVHDVSPYTRAAVLKVWVFLLEDKAVPVRRINAVVELAVDRLLDKTASVRKQALSVLTSVLDNNPFSGNLNEEAFLSKRKELEVALKERIEILRESAAPAIELDLISGKNLPEEHSSSNAGTADNGSEKVADNFEGDEGEEVDEDVDEDDDFINSDDVKQDAEVIVLRDQTTFVVSVLEFLNTLSQAMSKIEDIGRSKSTPEVVEVVRFFVRAVNFNVKGTKKCLQSTFSLVWHQEKAVKDECLQAFKSAYLTDGAASQAESLAPEEVASNLINVCQMCDSSELASLEQIIGELFAQENVCKSVVTSLWNIALSQSKDISERVRKSGSLNILAIVAKFQPDILTAVRIQQISQIVLQPTLSDLVTGVESGVLEEGGRKWAEHINTLKAAAKCLQMCSRSGLSITKPTAAGSTDELSIALASCVTPLRDLILGSFCFEDESITRKWFSACEEAMVSLFHIHQSPDRLLASIIAPLFGSLSGSFSPSEDSVSSTGSSSKVFCSAARLSRLLFVLGQGALCTLVYAEKLADLAKKASDCKSSKSKDDKEDGDKDAADAMEDEMGMAAAADADHERIFNHVVERQLVFDNILGKFHPLIAFIVANEAGGKLGGKGPFCAPIVRETALLALCRYMCVSNGLCEMYLPLLFTALEREEIDTNRTTVMIALADLAFRFPNALEPWTTRMYGRLSDDSASVRYNTLMVLTHLILNDMIKVKGQVSHVVMCLNDKCEQVRDLANLFFNKLAERSNNPVYNLLGDIIATLSMDKRSDSAADKSVSPTSVTRAVKERDTADNTGIKMDVDPDSPDGQNVQSSHVDDVITSEVVAVAAVEVDESSLPRRVLSPKEFQFTLKFLLSFVKKDKQADMLFERLITRLGLAQTSTQRRNLAYCISELPVSPKGLKKLVELFKLIKDALHDTQVFDYIQSTVIKAKKALSMKTKEGTAVGSSEAQGEGVVVPVTATSSGEVKGVFEELESLLKGVGHVKGSSSAANQEEGDEAAVGEEGEDGEERAVVAAVIPRQSQRNSKEKGLKKGAKAKASTGGRKSSKKRDVSSSDEDEDGSSDTEEDEVPFIVKGRQASRTSDKRKVVSKKSQHEDDEDEMDFE